MTKEQATYYYYSEKFNKEKDELMYALYGEYDNEDGGESYAKEYHYELDSMEEEYINYIMAMQNVSLAITADELMKFLVYSEYMHIGWDERVKDTDWDKLRKVVEKLLP